MTMLDHSSDQALQHSMDSFNIAYDLRGHHFMGTDHAAPKLHAHEYAPGASSSMQTPLESRTA
jgi:hypothetical protein